MIGLVHEVAVAPSRLQVKVDAPAVEWKAMAAVVELVSAGGDESMTVAGVVE